MKIAGATVRMDASHLKTQQYEVSESLRARVGDRRAGSASLGSARTAVQQSAPQAQLSDAGKTAQSSEADAIQQGLDDAEKDPKLILIRAMIAMLTGREVKVFNASAWQSSEVSVTLQTPTQSVSAQPATLQNAGYGIEYDRSESYNETEATRFAASGVVKTSDGREISFSLELSMTRSYSETSSISVHAGDARQKQDPLVLNFNGTAAQLTSQRFKFDLNADGQAEDINFATGGSGFLALDRNGDGQINNGTELFGASSGNGFAELAALDTDHNGWIDENDAAYDQLRVLSKDGNGNDQLATLRQANVGAMSLGRVATPFDLKDSGNALQGQVRTSGVFLQEDGKAGTMQQIDLTV